MPEWLIKPGPGLIEPAPALEIFVDHIGAIERLDGVLRVYYCTNQSVLGAERRQQTVAVKLIWPLSRVPAAKQIWRRALDQAVPNNLALVRAHH